MAENPYALNETIRLIFRIVSPFVIMMIVGCLTRTKDRQALDRFFVKMKTPVLADRQADRQQMELSYADPHRFDHIKMFPNSNWEFRKWKKVDAIGFSVAVLITIAILGLFILLLSIGR